MRILVLAPHVVFPVRNGADKYIVSKWGALRGGGRVEMIASDGVYFLDSEGGWCRCNDEPCYGEKSRLPSAISSLVSFAFGRHQFLYYRYKSDYLKRIAKSKANESWDLIVYSFFGVHELFFLEFDGPPPVRTLIETHNYDPKIYSDRANEASWPRSAMYSVAGQRAAAYIRSLSKSIDLCALGEGDAALYRQSAACEVHCCSIGMSRRPLRTIFPSECDPLRFAFVGSLGIQMNAHSISQFVERDWGKIRLRYPTAELYVIGSNPSESLVASLERCGGVKVKANLSDEDLFLSLHQCHFTLIPFRESNGLKLKVGLSLECGVPILSFMEMDRSLEQSGFAFSSARVNDWFSQIDRMRSIDVQRDMAGFAHQYCSSHTWEDVAKASLKGSR